jgi:two-component system sensor histidine kinase BaeS
MAKRRVLFGPIAIRLGLASLGIALGAISVVVGLTLYSARGDVSTLVRQQQESTAATTAKAVADAYRATGSWETADLRVPATLAVHSEAHLTVLDERGRSVSVPSVPNDTRPRVLTGPLLSSPVVVRGKRVGRAVLHFYGAALPTAEASLRDALVSTVAQSAGVAALLALAVAVLFSRRITRPVTALTRAVRSFEAGNHSARVGGSYAKGELIELTRSFDRLADTITQEEDLRRVVMADVAHELRTPLSVLQATTESLVDGIIDPSAETLSSLHDEVLRLGRVVEDLDTLASAEAAQLHIELQAVDVAEHVEPVVNSLQPRFHEAGVSLVVDLAHVRAKGDPYRIEQITFNLLSNALKFTNQGGTVVVRVRPRDGAGVLEVVDTGVGIPSEELPHVFDRFWRGREAGRLAGSGIGLAVVRTLVDAQGGTIDVESQPDHGSRFLVTFPPLDQSSQLHPSPEPVVSA